LSPGNPGQPLIPGGPRGQGLHGGGLKTMLRGHVLFGVMPGVPAIPAAPGEPGFPGGPAVPRGPPGPVMQQP